VRNLNQDTITQAVIARFAQTPDPRLKEIMTSLVQHLHAFAREVKLTEAEWMAGIQFLTATGQKCNDQRQEFILLSDTLGLSMLTVAMNNDKPAGCTEATVFGPSMWRARRTMSMATMWPTARWVSPASCVAG
jgi:hydroxyquinol 1,2-dioxygenase